MTQTISWINVLNEESQWHSQRDLSLWLSSIFGSTVRFKEADLERFQGRLDNMRSTIDVLHFGGKADMRWLDDELAKIRLTVCYEDFLPQSLHGVWPLLHAKIKSANGHDLLDALAQTILIPFTDFVTGALVDKNAPTIARCEGLFRQNNQSEISLVRSITEASELKWRLEIDFLKQNDLLKTATVQRCADIFVAAPKAKFCSDTCRFTTFQLVKQLKDPRYHADKQKKYRTRLADKE